MHSETYKCTSQTRLMNMHAACKCASVTRVRAVEQRIKNDKKVNNSQRMLFEVPRDRMSKTCRPRRVSATDWWRWWRHYVTSASHRFAIGKLRFGDVVNSVTSLSADIWPSHSAHLLLMLLLTATKIATASLVVVVSSLVPAPFLLQNRPITFGVTLPTYVVSVWMLRLICFVCILLFYQVCSMSEASMPFVVQ